MARSSSPGRRDKSHKHKEKHKERDKEKDRDKESRREAERRDRDKDREKHRDRERDHDREREREKDRDKERDREKSRERQRGDRDRYKERYEERDRDRSRREYARSKSRSKSPDDRDRKRRRKEDEKPALSKEELEKQRKAEEQAALEAEMERRRQKVEEWRKKKQEEELRQQQEQAAMLVEQEQQQQQGDQKGWTLSDDDDLEDEDQDMQQEQQQANGSSPPAADVAAQADDDDDEVDPLDAFMAGNEQAFKKDLKAAAELQKQEDEEIDPLDAFMATTVVPQASSALAAALPQQGAAAVKQEQQEQGAAGAVKMEVDEKPAALGTAVPAVFAAAPPRRRPVRRYNSDSSSDDSSDEEDSEMDDEEWAKAVTAGKLSKSDKLGVVDHATINYPPFRKNFYIEVPELARLAPAEVDVLRKELDGIKVRGVNIPKPVRAWTQCGLSSRVMEVLRKAGFDKPLPIQAQALPIIMSGRDCIGIAKTGSGKTLGFVVPMLRHIKDQRPIQQGDGPVALIMAPTRELVSQITKEVKTFAKPLGMTCVAVFGGSGVANQIRELKRGSEVVACTPGRMIDLLATGSGRITNLRRVTYLVLDEADRMFDMGFEPQIMRIVNNIRPDRQTVLFSATFPRQVEALARSILQDPVEIQVGGRSVVNSDIEQVIEIRPEDERYLRLLELLGEWYERGKIIIFVHTQDKCDTLFRDLLNSGYPCLSLHGGKDQVDRQGTIDDFKGGVCNILVATSVAARGLDVKDLVLVVNHDVPNHHEDYVHRVGRTGRAGNKGTAVTFIGPDEERYAPDLVKALKESGAPVAEDLQALADSFTSKRKAGLVQAHGSGFGGSGYKFDASEEDKHKQARKAQAKEYGITEEASESDDDDGDIRLQTAAPPKPKEQPKEAAAAVGADGQPVAAAEPATTGHQPAAPATNEELLANAQRAAMQMAGTAPAANAANFAAMAAARAAALAAAWGIGGGGGGGGGAGASTAAPAAPQFETTLDINDFPQHARWKVTHKDAMAMITELTGAAVTTKGIYIAPGRPIPEGESRLHLLIEAPTEQQVKRAKQEIKRILEETTEKVMRRDAPAAGGKYSVM